MDYIGELLKACLSAGAVAAVLAFFGRSLFEHWLKEHMEKNLAAFKQQLTEDTAIRTTLLKDQLDAQASVLRAQLAEDTAIRTTLLKGQLDTQASELGARLSEETSIRTEMLKDHLATNSVFRTEARKSELSQNVQMALEVARWRQPAYAALWSMMEIVSFRRPVELTPDIRRQLADNLTEFYYRDGHALYLSVASMECFMVARDLLCSQEDVSDAMIREEFSKLRTQMKVDLTVYTPEQLKSGLPLENRAYLQLEPHEIRL